MRVVRRARVARAVPWQNWDLARGAEGRWRSALLVLGPQGGGSVARHGRSSPVIGVLRGFTHRAVAPPPCSRNGSPDAALAQQKHTWIARVCLPGGRIWQRKDLS